MANQVQPALASARRQCHRATHVRVPRPAQAGLGGGWRPGSKRRLNWVATRRARPRQASMRPRAPDPR